ncbi:MAG: hypothetical protein WBA93_33615 [Microcoleaceae cyanobacterium]
MLTSPKCASSKMLNNGHIHCQYLLNSQTDRIITNFANHLEKVSHERINSSLKTETLNFLRTAVQTQDVWRFCLGKAPLFPSKTYSLS